ncbi:MAG: hypothetical protein ABEJ90_03365 [Halobacterium sp.]
MSDDDPPRAASHPPGYDEDDPYEDEDLSTYPSWWRRNVTEFRDHGMRPYRPPRFADGTLTPPLVADLEADLGVEIRFRSVDPQAGGEWHVVVDGDAVAEVPRYRDGGGYTVYDLPPTEFERLVRRAVGE